MSSPPPKHSLSSPTSGNSPQPVLPTPSSSTSVSIRHNPAMLRQELERQLVEKQRQLQESHSGIGKNVLARQVSQLQDKLRDLDAVAKDLESAPSSSSERLRSLERDFTSFRSHPLSPGMSTLRNKEKLLNQRSNGLDPLPSPTTSTLLPPAHDSTSLLPLPPPPTGSTPTKRRSKVPNADRRNTDIEFATEIGQGLLLEVRKMQALLQEKEEKLRTLETQKADLERAAEAMTKQMRQREENEEKLKEETWNLELAKQELTISVTELQQNLNKANVEQSRLAKQVNELRSDIEHLRDREEKLNSTMDNMKQRHEQDMSSIRRHAAAVQREKSEQMKQIEALNSELAIAKAQSRISKHIHSESEPTSRSAQQNEDDQGESTLAVQSESATTSSPAPSSPKQSPRNQAMEVETLKTSLAHAHRMVSNLRSNLLKEKTEKFELKKLLAESQETIEVLQNDHRMWVDTRSTNNQDNGKKFKSSASGVITPKRRKLRKNRHPQSRSTLDDSETDSRKQRRRHKISSDNDSVYSYSSMSELGEESEEASESDDKEELHSAFRPLSSELSQSQKTPVVVDAQVNTEPVIETNTAPRSLGDELGMAMSSASPIEEIAAAVGGGLVTDAMDLSKSTEIATQTGPSCTGIEIMTQTEPEVSVMDHFTQTINEPVECSIQTDEIIIPQSDVLIQTDALSLTESTLSSFSEAPVEPVAFSLVSLPALESEPEDPQIAKDIFTAAVAEAVAADRMRALENGIHTGIQSEPEDPKIAEDALAAAVTEALENKRALALERSVDASTQIDHDLLEAYMQSEFTKHRNQQVSNAISSGTQSDPKLSQEAMEAAFAEHRAKSLAEATSVATQSEPEDPAIAEAAIAAAVAAALPAAVAEALEAKRALETPVDVAVQSEPEDPAIAEAAITAAVAEALAAKHQDTLEKSVDVAVQSEDQKINEEALSAALAAALPIAVAEALPAAVAEALAAKHQEALEKSVNIAVQSEPEDPKIAEQALAAALAAAIPAAVAEALPEAVAEALPAAVAEALDAKKAEALEKSVDVSIQSEPEDPKIAEQALATALAAALPTAVAEALAAKKAEALEKSIDVSVQSEPEDPKIAEKALAAAVAAALPMAVAEALPEAVTDALAAKKAEALEKSIDVSIQSEPEDPKIAEKALAAAVAAALPMAVAEALPEAVTDALAAKKAEALEKSIDVSVQSEPEDPKIAEEALATALAAALPTAIADALAAKKVEALERSVDVSIQSDPEDPKIAEAIVAAAVAAALPTAVAEALAAKRADSLDTAVQSESVDAKDSEIQCEVTVLDQFTQSDIIESVDTAVQSEQVKTKDCDTQYVLENVGVSIGIQSEDTVTVDYETQSNEYEVKDIAVQAQLPKLGVEVNTQYTVDKKDVHVQSDFANNDSLPVIPLTAPVSPSEDDDAFFDASSNIKSISNGDENVKSSDEHDALLNESDLTPSSETAPNAVQTQARSIPDNTAISSPTSKEDDEPSMKEKPVEESKNMSRSIVPAAIISKDANKLPAENTPIEESRDEIETIHDGGVLNNSNSPVAEKSVVEDRPTKETETLISESKKDQPLDDKQPITKMYTKEEADALIAAAVAAAIAKLSGSKDSINLTENNVFNTEKKPVVLSNDDIAEREVEGVSIDTTRERDASVLSSTSTAGFDDDDDDDVGLTTGTAIVYSEEPSMEYRSFRNLSSGPSTTFHQDPIIFTPSEEEEAPNVVVSQQKQPQVQLCDSTGTVFSQEPMEVIEDIPIRPSSPPPPALLNKATFSDIRPLSPSSARSNNKGKSPMEPSENNNYPNMGMESFMEEDAAEPQHSHQLSPTSDRMGTITSMSTASTQDNLQSIHSAQYDPNATSTNPNMIALITQTMIGDWLYKYTRKAVGGGISENRHQRYFWIHPYTRTLYWSNTAPGLNDQGGKAKSALIENIIAVPDYTAGPPGLPNMSLLIQTSHRQLKLTAPTMEKHEIWFEAISHLIQRQNNNGTMSILNETMKNRSISSSTSKQNSLRRLNDLFQTPQSVTTGDTSHHDDDLLDDDDDEAIEDVRMCCNGKHHVSKLEKDHLHRHTYRRRKSHVA